MEIELLDLYQRATGHYGTGDPWDQPEMPDGWRRRLDAAFGRRRDVCIEYSWSVPTREAIFALVAVSPLIDPMAGTGYWAKLITEAGGDVIASDVILPGDDAAPIEADNLNPWHAKAERQWFPLGRVDAIEAAASHPERTLVLSWVPYGDPTGAAVEDAYWQAGGQRLVYVGEPGHGCTGEEVLHSRLGWGSSCYIHDYDGDPEWEDCNCDLPSQRWTPDAEIPLPQWPGMNDGLFIFHRKEP